MWFGQVEPNHDLIAEKIQQCDSILITHAHFDHLMDVPDVVHNTGATALGSTNSYRLLAACGVPEEQLREIKAGDRFTLKDFEVAVSRSQHMRTPGFSPGRLPPDPRPPKKASDYLMDENFSFLISVGGYRLLTDPGERPGAAPRADILFVFPYRDEAYYKSLLPRVQPKIVIPTHWDDFFRPLSKPLRPLIKPPKLPFPKLRRINLTEFGQMIERISPETKYFVPEIFHTYDLAEIV
jgi:L-ascorbate metabolism protein UlaG (beta-lactamase superfamily)